MRQTGPAGPVTLLLIVERILQSSLAKIYIRQNKIIKFAPFCHQNNDQIRDSIVASIPACHAGDRGSIPRVGDSTLYYYH